MGEDVHVVPDFGRPHVLSGACWCTPVKDQQTAVQQPAGPHLWIHNLEN